MLNNNLILKISLTVISLLLVGLIYPVLNGHCLLGFMDNSSKIDAVLDVPSTMSANSSNSGSVRLQINIPCISEFYYDNETESTGDIVSFEFKVKANHPAKLYIATLNEEGEKIGWKANIQQGDPSEGEDITYNTVEACNPLTKKLVKFLEWEDNTGNEGYDVKLSFTVLEEKEEPYLTEAVVSLVPDSDKALHRRLRISFLVNGSQIKIIKITEVYSIPSS